MPKQNKHEEIETNEDEASKKRHIFKVVLFSLLIFDIIAIPILILVMTNNNKTESVSSLSISSGPSNNEEVNQFASKMVDIANHEIKKDYDDNCSNLVCITYTQKELGKYDYTMMSYSNSGKLYKITLLDITSGQSSPETYLLNQTLETIDNYGFLVSYTSVTKEKVLTSNSCYYISEGPDHKELVTGFYYKDNTYYVYQEQENDDLSKLKSTQPKQVFNSNGIIEKYYAQTLKGE